MLFLSLLALQFLAQSFKYNMKISIPPYIAYLHLYIKISHLMKILSPLKLCNCICKCNISHHIKILSHFILWYFYPYFRCSFWPQVLNSDMEISILLYIALFKCVYVKCPTLWKFYPTLHFVISIPTCITFFVLCVKHSYENIYPTK